MIQGTMTSSTTIRILENHDVFVGGVLVGGVVALAGSLLFSRRDNLVKLSARTAIEQSGLKQGRLGSEPGTKNGKAFRIEEQENKLAAEALITTTRSIINYKSVKEEAQSIDGHHGKLQARSIPNERLKTVFGIDNIFTTTDTAWAPAFRKVAVGKLNDASQRHTKSTPPTEDWRPVINVIRHATNSEADRLGRNFRIDVFIRNVTCRVSLLYLFKSKLRSEDPDPHTVEAIATSINELWIVSKSLPADGQLGKQHTEAKACLLNNLHALVDYDKSDPRDNPLNLLLPAYETMWRVVKMGFQEL